MFVFEIYFKSSTTFINFLLSIATMIDPNFDERLQIFRLDAWMFHDQFIFCD